EAREAEHDSRHGPQPAAFSERLQVSPALSGGSGYVPARRADASRNHARPFCPLSFCRRAQLAADGRRSDMNEPLVSVQRLKKHFPVRRGVFSQVVAHVQAVDDISFEIQPGETLGLVGESGCGKTTAGRTILRLIAPSAGTIRFDGRDLMAARGSELRTLRRDMQIVFQDPFSSLNPRMTIKNIVEEG